MSSYKPRRSAVWAGVFASVFGFLSYGFHYFRDLKGDRDQLRELMDNAADAFFIHNTEGKILDANWEACRSLGYEKDELLSLKVSDIEQGFSQDVLEEQWGKMSPRSPVALEGTHKRRDGTTFPVEVRIGRLESGGEHLLFAIARDATRRKKNEGILRESERRFRQLFENSVDALFIHDKSGRILECNDEACQSLGYTREELLSLKVGDITVNLLSEEEREARKGDTLWERVMRGEPGRIVGFDQNELRRKDGTTFPVEVGVGSIEYGGEKAIFASIRDITARRQLENELRHQALHDPLTDIPNRALFNDRLEHALAQTERRGNYVAVFFVDLDRFKSINDNLGHEAGDQLLVTTARRLLECVRASDTVARLGGDEFTVLLEDLDDPDEVLPIVERMLKHLDEPYKIKGREVKVTASIGIAYSSSSSLKASELTDQADNAMYRAKEAGRARYEFYEPLA